MSDEHIASSISDKDQGRGEVLIPEQPANTAGVIKNVAKYFMTFLETDFQKRRLPKRNTNTFVINNNKVGYNLERYPALKKIIFKNFGKTNDELSITIKPGQYVSTLPSTLLAFVAERINEIDQQRIVELVIKVQTVYLKAKESNLENYEDFLIELKDSIRSLFDSDLVAALIHDVKNPLIQAGVSEQSGLFQLQSNIDDHLCSLLEESILNFAPKYYSSKDVQTIEELITSDAFEILTPSSIKCLLLEDFEDFATHDCFKDLYQLSRSLQLLDKTELYLYLFELEINLENKDNFPLFYVPIRLDHEDSTYILTFDNRLFINTKGFEFVCQEYSDKIKKPITPDKFDRILYSESENNLRDKLENIIKRVIQTLDLDEVQDLNTSAVKVSSNTYSSLSNTASLFVFDKSDEALINDYEEILNDDGELHGLFAELLQSFISTNPTRFDEDVDIDWESLDIPDKLLTESPIPLNEEQKKVVMALKRNDCKVMILEGPPGTGKSHTITSVICQSVLEGKSVLVLSDKKEALDVVEDKISSTLNKVRTGEDFQNPILRLGAMGKGIGKVVDGTVLNAIKQHYSTYRKNEENFDTEYLELITKTKSELNENTTYFSELSLNKIKDFFKVDAKYGEFLPPFEAFVRPIDELRVTKILLTLQYLKKVEINHRGTIELAQVFPGISEMNNSVALYNRSISVSSSLGSDIKDAVKLLLRYQQNTSNDLFKLTTSTKELILLSESDIGKVLLPLEHDQTYGRLLRQLQFTSNAIKVGSKIYEYLAPNHNGTLAGLYASICNDVSTHPKDALTALEEFMGSLQTLKLPVIGFTGKRSKIDLLILQLRKTVPGFQLSSPEKDLSSLLALKSTLEYAINLVSESFNDDKNILKTGLIFCSLLTKDYNYFIKANLITDTLTTVSGLADNTHGALDSILLTQYDKIETAISSNNLENKIIEETSNYCNFIAKVNSSSNALSLTWSDIVTFFERYKLLIPDTLGKAKLELGFIDSLNDTEKQLIYKINNSDNLATIGQCNHPILSMNHSHLDELFTYLRQESELSSLFTCAPSDEYIEEQSLIEGFNTAKMAYTLDKHILEYSTSKAAELQTLRGLIKKKQKIPQSLFGNLKQAFPCILAGIRDYAEYIPLQKGLFDLIIIDEASQVSIAQALPAFIRAKKILILGDDKQFSNVKAGNASKDRNQYFRHELLEVFKRDNPQLSDLEVFEYKIKENFDVKRSVLDFTRFISNYQIQLKKHFRCYPEIISYSNKYFYRNSLECVKLRTVPISEVLKFDVIEHDNRVEKFAKTNTLEASFILATLMGWHERNEKRSVGIITPHNEQARIISETLYKSSIWGWLEKECSIKIMTFDGCQGEEKDYIFYSMVASRVSDRLGYIFAADFANSENHVEHLNAQRLNVGFSRAKNTAHFVLSKPVSEFKGEIHNALKHYLDELENASKIHIGGTDENSPMERKIQEWLYQTNFYQEHKELEVIPQYPIGQYLKYLDPGYTHPRYKVDFMLVLGKDSIILEYDGFKEHFEFLNEVNSTNYRSYQKPKDYYRQKLLESYGYRFLRVNKFNLGKDAVVSLDKMLSEKFKKKTT